MTDHVVARLRASIAAHATRPATRIRIDDGWRIQTYAEFGEQVRRVAQGLLDRGVNAGERVGIFMANRPEWSEIDFGCGTVRAVPVPLYATSTPEQIRHIGLDSGLSVMFVGSREECERVLD